MVICERCGKEHDGSYGSGRFCSKSCATRNSNTFYERQKQEAKVRQETPIWETRVCPKCGKSFTINRRKTNKKFCSRKCSNSHVVTHTHKEKVSRSIMSYLESNNIVPRHLRNYNLTCTICSKQFQSKNKNKRTCSPQCATKLRVKTGRENNSYYKFGGDRPNHCHSRAGYYKGIFCGSTYELVWVIYNLDNHVNFYRCKDRFMYKYNNLDHFYCPDFILEDGTYIEIKGSWTDQVEVKTNSVLKKGLNIKVLYRKDLENCFNYVKNKFGIHDKLYRLYDNYQPHKIKCKVCGIIFYSDNPKRKVCSYKCAGKSKK